MSHCLLRATQGSRQRCSQPVTRTMLFISGHYQSRFGSVYSYCRVGARQRPPAYTCTRSMVWVSDTLHSRMGRLLE